MKFLRSNLLKILMALFSGLSGFHTYGQQIVWEKVWGIAPGDDEIDIIQPTEDGNFLALGKSDKYFQQIGTGLNFFEGAALIKFNQNGDTLFQKPLNIPVERISHLVVKFGNVYRAVFSSPINIANVPTFYPCVVEFNSEGIILQTKYLINFENYVPTSCFQTSDYGLVMGGYFNGGLTSPTNMMAIKVNFLNEVEWSSQYFPPVLIAGNGNRIEPMLNGNYLLTGTMGRRIYGFEIDSAGNDKKQWNFYETPTNRIFDMGYSTQNWRNTFLTIGGYDSTGSGKRKVAIFLKDTLGNKIWGGETDGVPGRIYPNKELSFIYSGWDKTNRWVSRIDKDSNVLWKVNFGSYNSDRKVIYDLLFTTPDTGIVAGVWLTNSGNLGRQFYIAKIAGVGTAYNPLQPEDTVSVLEQLFLPKNNPIVYPNPAKDQIRFQKLLNETKVSIYSKTGKKLFEKTILPNESVDVFNLPIGVYLYHLKSGKSVFTGRFLKD